MTPFRRKVHAIDADIREAQEARAESIVVRSELHEATPQILSDARDVRRRGEMNHFGLEFELTYRPLPPKPRSI